MHLRHIMGLLAVAWPWDAENYPPLGGPRSNDREGFRRDHVMKHLQILFGRLAEISERADHGRALPEHLARDRVTDAVAKIVATALGCAAAHGVSARDTEERILRVFHPPAPARCRLLNAACSPRVEAYRMRSAWGGAFFCTYHAAGNEDVLHEDGRPVTLAYANVSGSDP